MCVVVAAEQVLDAGAGSGESDAKVDRILGDELDALEDCRVSFREVPGRRERAGAREKELDALLRRGIVGEESERFREPVGSACGRAMRGCLACLAQDGNRRCVSLPSGALHVVGALGCARAAAGKGLSAPLVGPESPAGRS